MPTSVGMTALWHDGFCGDHRSLLSAVELLLGILVVFLCLRLLMMPDGCAGCSTRDGMPTANLMACQCTDRGPFGGTGRLFVLRVGSDSQPTYESDGNDKCAHARVS
jgi:hypothetical protein